MTRRKKFVVVKPPSRREIRRAEIRVELRGIHARLDDLRAQRHVLQVREERLEKELARLSSKRRPETGIS